jgi:YacP-like NYN domain
MHAPLGRPTRRFLGGAVQTLGIVAGFVGLGLLAAALVAGADGERGPRGAELAPPHYLLDVDPADPDPARAPTVWLVDGYNALHAGLLRGGARDGAWWSGAGREALLERVRRFDGGAGAVWVVFDGPDARELPDPGAPGGGAQPRLVFAPSADDWLLRRARDAAPGEVAIVTADRRLAARARARGATVVSPREFLARCAGDEAASI